MSTQIQNYIAARKKTIAVLLSVASIASSGTWLATRKIKRLIREFDRKQAELYKSGHNEAKDPRVSQHAPQQHVQGPVATEAAPSRRRKVAVDATFLVRLIRLIQVIVPGPFSREAFQLFMLTVALVARTFLTLKIAEITGGNARMLVSRNQRGFVLGVLRLALFAVPASMVNSALKYFTNLLQLNFRQRLSRDLHEKYLNGMAFYRASSMGSDIDNIDQRITQDTDKFATAFSTVYGTTFKPVLDIVLLSAKLAAVVGVTGPFTMYLYYAISAFILRLIMPSFPRLTAEQQRLEGDYRYVHSRAINYAEEIAFFAGQKKERQVMDVSFDRLYRHMRNIFTKQAWLGVIDSWLVKYGATMIGYAVVAGPVFGSIGQGKTQGNLDTSKITGDYVRNSHILINLARAIGQLIVLYKNITQLAGYTARVSELREVLTHYTTSAVTSALDDDTVIGDGPTAKRLIGEQIAFHDVAVVSPDGVLLLDNLTFEVAPGTNLLISGPNGSGKSSVFRIMSGLWPLKRGTVTRPPVSTMFYIPQKPYLTIGTLRDQISYPDIKVYTAAEKAELDPKLNALMEQVELSYLVKREGWDKENDWNEVLSMGEQQRIAMARLFYHCPKFAILDECTSQLSLDIEAFLYQRCKELNITVITVAHRKSVWKYHDRVLKFDGMGHYEFRPLSDHELRESEDASRIK
jgi:ATP-binding cassette subfamily D (ALD) protein 3